MEFVRTMDLTSKQRAQLRGLANRIDTILIVGKEGIGDNLVKQANDALEARELIKGRVLENALMSARGGGGGAGPPDQKRGGPGDRDQICSLPPEPPEGQKDKIVLVEGKKRESVPQRGAIKNRIVSEERQQEGLKRKKG